LEDSFLIDRDLDEADSAGLASDKFELEELPAELDGQVRAFLMAARKLKPDAVPDKGKRDEISLLATGDAIVARLKEYPTTIEEDAEIFEKSGGRHRMAVEVRMGEKALLIAARDLVAKKLTVLAAEAMAREPVAKRRRLA